MQSTKFSFYPGVVCFDGIDLHNVMKLDQEWPEVASNVRRFRQLSTKEINSFGYVDNNDYMAIKIILLEIAKYLWFHSPSLLLQLW